MRARTSKSLPEVSASGMDLDCTSVGRMYPSRARDLRRRESMPMDWQRVGKVEFGSRSFSLVDVMASFTCFVDDSPTPLKVR